jgi:hypothetical protein
MPIKRPHDVKVMHCTDLGRLENVLDTVSLKYLDSNQSKLYMIDESHILKHIGMNRGLSRLDSRLLANSLLRYRSQLEDSGWLIPEIHEMAFMDTEDESHLWIAEDFVKGRNGIDILGDHPTSLSSIYIQKIIHQVYATTQDTSPIAPLSASVDLKPSNVIMDDSGKIWLVDTITPKALDQDGNIEFYIDNLEEVDRSIIQSVCSTLDGAILRFLKKCRECWQSISDEDFIYEISYILARLAIPEDVIYRWLEQVDNRFPHLSELYAK